MTHKVDSDAMNVDLALNYQKLNANIFLENVSSK